MSLHQTTCILFFANMQSVEVERHFWNMIRDCIVNNSWLTTNFPFLDMQEISSYFPGRPRSPQALLPGMACKEIESSSAKQRISTPGADFVQRIQDA